MDNKTFAWRMWTAVILTSVGALYYLVFLFYMCGGVPIEKIHYYMTDKWPNFYADNVALVAPVFLIVGLGLWYWHFVKSKPKAAAEPEYQFEFNVVENTSPIKTQPEYIFESGQTKKLNHTNNYTLKSGKAE